jgi:hypothetical protein
LENVRVNTIILKWIFKGIYWVGVYWLFLAQDEDKGDGSFEDVCETSGEIMWGGGLSLTRWVTVSF